MSIGKYILVGKYILGGPDKKTPMPTDDIQEWVKQFENIAARRVALDKIGAVEISTVFLGLDHFGDGGPPLLFETMVLGGPLDEEQERCSTWAEAEAQHKAMVEKVRAAGGKS